jgi:hypothetical protein
MSHTQQPIESHLSKIRLSVVEAIKDLGKRYAKDENERHKRQTQENGLIKGMDYYNQLSKIIDI